MGQNLKFCGNCGKEKRGEFRQIWLPYTTGTTGVCPLCFAHLAAARPTVDHPPHYGGDTPHETIKCLEAWGLESDALLWNAVKYISRAGKKGNKLEDLKKAKNYLDRRIAAMEGK
jgi:hypothetical protein